MSDKPGAPELSRDIIIEELILKNNRNVSHAFIKAHI